MIAEATDGFSPETRMITVSAIAMQPLTIKVLASKAARYCAMLGGDEPRAVIYRSLCCGIPIEEINFLFHGRYIPLSASGVQSAAVRCKVFHRARRINLKLY